MENDAFLHPSDVLQVQRKLFDPAETPTRKTGIPLHVVSKGPLILLSRLGVCVLGAVAGKRELVETTFLSVPQMEDSAGSKTLPL